MVIVEGCYTSLIDNVEIRVFIDRNYKQTQRARSQRDRDPHEGFLERVLAIEHQEISTHRQRSNIVIDAPAEELEHR